MARILPLSPAFREGLRGLDLVARRRQPGAQGGERTGNRKGQGVEFADHRPYVPGDDPRFLDWNVYARLGRPVVKEFLEEADLALTVLVDGSDSMSFGDPARFDWACTLAYVLTSIALSRHDRAGVAVLGESGSVVPPGKGGVQLNRIEELLRKAGTAGRTALAPAVSRHLATYRPDGIVIVVTDLYDPAGPEGLVDCLVHHGCDARLVLVTDDREADAVPIGPVELVDGETGEVAKMLVTPATRTAYVRTLREWREAALGYAVDRGVTGVEGEVHRPVEAFVADLARRGEVLR